MGAASRPWLCRQRPLFEYEGERVEPRWVQVNVNGVRVENCREFGGPWLALELISRLKLDEFLDNHQPAGEEHVRWSLASMILVIARLLNPSSELYIAEHWYASTALPDLLGVAAERVDDNRLYRALDELLPHKKALEKHLKERLGELFKIEYDLLLYDVTSTYFEGQCASNPQAQLGYSRDQRGDCKQVCIALVVSRCGMPLGYRVFAGNTADVTTVKTIVEDMEEQYGASESVWVMDRGMVSEANLKFLRDSGRRYIIGAAKSMLKKFERQILQGQWHQIRDGLEVKFVELPADSSDESSTTEKTASEPVEVYILCRSQARREKDAAIVRRFDERIEKRLKAAQARCEKQNRDPMKVERELGRLFGKNTRGAQLFEVKVDKNEAGFARITWKRRQQVCDWHSLSDGCYLLRSNVTTWSDEELWKAYIQLTEAENAFRIEKSDLRIRPVWHQKEDRVQGHILVCFLAYVLWKTLGQLCRQAGLGDEPRRVIDELSELRTVDVVLPTNQGIDICHRYVTQHSEHQQILLDKLRLTLPKKIIQNRL
jgi:transposase